QPLDDVTDGVGNAGHRYQRRQKGNDDGDRRGHGSLDEVGRILDTPGGDRADRGEDRLDQLQNLAKALEKGLDEIVDGEHHLHDAANRVRETGEPAEPPMISFSMTNF